MRTKMRRRRATVLEYHPRKGRLYDAIFLLLVLVSLVTCSAEVEDKSSETPPPSPSSSSFSASSTSMTADSVREGSNGKSPGKVISLVESINRSTKLYLYPDPERAKASKEQWERALREIKSLSNPSRSIAASRKMIPASSSPPPTVVSKDGDEKEKRSDDSDGDSSEDKVDRPIGPKNATTATRLTTSGSGNGNTNKGIFSQWRLLSEPTRVELDPETNATSSSARSYIPRFEGFASWERMLQDWADDVQEYMDKLEAESGAGYPMSTYGTVRDSNALIDDDDDDDEDGNEKSDKVKQEPKDGHQKTHGTANAIVDGDSSAAARRREWKPISLPIPAPARDGEAVVPNTDLSDKSKRIWIVTTAALPWMTGTAVNPLLRAAYMTEGREEAGGCVTLMLPWLERRRDQEHVYGAQKVFESPAEQEDYIRTWLRDMAKLPLASERLRIEWYTAWQNKVENSIYSMGDITALIPETEVDIMILEEPEHLNWYRAPGESWTVKFKHVVGIVHTNYFVYAQEQPAAFVRAPGMRLLCSWMCRAHCHRIIKLSGTLGQFAPEKELIENVHGIRANFLEAGSDVGKRIQADPSSDPVFGAEAEPSVYFIGKMLWSKGIGSLMELLKYAEESAGIKIDVDMYGGGPDLEAAKARAKSLGVDMEFHGPIDHGELAFSHKIFINPSTSEVLCTTVAEALGMGKFVVIPSHPSNDFFNVFPNCLSYTNKEEFVGNLYYALTHSPEPMTKEYSHALSWQAATERLEAAGSIPVKEAELMAAALSSNDASVEISLPPLIEDEEGRKIVASGLRRSRLRYRQFRSRLSQEVMQSKVLPPKMKQRFMAELDKRLELDIDEALDSPKLRLQLSPAELDKQLLELYKKVADGPSGDILRIIGGGKEVAMQDLYIKRKAARERAKNPRSQKIVTFGPFEALGDDSDEEKRTASQWVNLVLRRNLPNGEIIVSREEGHTNNKIKRKSKTKLSLTNIVLPCRTTWTKRHYPPPTAYTRHTCLGRSPTASFSLLI